MKKVQMTLTGKAAEKIFDDAIKKVPIEYINAIKIIKPYSKDVFTYWDNLITGFDCLYGILSEFGKEAISLSDNVLIRAYGTDIHIGQVMALTIKEFLIQRFNLCVCYKHISMNYQIIYHRDNPYPYCVDIIIPAYESNPSKNIDRCIFYSSGSSQFIINDMDNLDGCNCNEQIYNFILKFSPNGELII